MFYIFGLIYAVSSIALVIFQSELWFQFFFILFFSQGNCAHFKVTSQINLDVTIDDDPIGQMTIGLFGDDAPKTVENFRRICIDGIDGRTYAGSRFHRVIDRFIVQGYFLF